MNLSEIGVHWRDGVDYCIITEIGLKRFDSDELKEYNAEVERVKRWLEDNKR